MENLLRKLISFKTLSENHRENLRAFKWIKSQLRGLPLVIKEFSSNGYPSLVILSRDTKFPHLILQCHMDVVSGSPEVFKPKIKNGILYGRGSFDMKFSLACYLRLLKELKMELKNLNLAVMITTDEEIGGENGVKHLLNKGYRSKVCFLPDGGQNWEIQKAAKGVLHLKIGAGGKSAHGSRPWLGVNAIDELMEFLGKIKNLFPKEPCGDKDHFHSTVNIGRIEGGKAVNQIPDWAQALVDIRLIPEDQIRIPKEIKKISHNFKQIKTEVLASGQSFKIDLDNPYLKLFTKIAESETKKKTVFITSHGSSDARYFAQRKIPVIATRPSGGGHHSENEWIDLKDLERFYRVLKRFVLAAGK